jgi:hypothetical protein
MTAVMRMLRMIMNEKAVEQRRRRRISVPCQRILVDQRTVC